MIQLQGGKTTAQEQGYFLFLIGNNKTGSAKLLDRNMKFQPLDLK